MTKPKAPKTHASIPATTEAPNPKDECYTPAWVFDDLQLQFSIDVCAPAGGSPHVTADQYFAFADDGLTADWGTGPVWMNPPYSKPRPWVEKFTEHRNGIALVPFSKGKWFEELWDTDAVMVCCPTNIKFIKDGKPHGIFMPTVFAAFGQECVDALYRLPGRARE
tara:strand:+ start:135 stop:629 length:495 start_codon:yes stop_codon:yes gene_type:complete